MPTGLARRLSLLLVALAFALVLGLWSRLPDPMPTHFDLAGKPDGFTPKPFGPLALPLVMAAVQALFLALPRLSPRVYEAPAQGRVMAQVELSLAAFLFVVTATTLLAALGVAVPVNRVLAAALGALVIALGVAMRALPRNPVVGIRTPWTLASDEVWTRTHALGARLFVLAGLVACVGGALGLHLVPILVALGTASVAPVFYSFRLYRKLEGNKPPRAG